MSDLENLIVIRGGGDLATACIYKLFACGFPVLVLETGNPTAIRRAVSFSQAVFTGEHSVEGICAKKISSFAEVGKTLTEGKIPILIDPEGASIAALRPFAVVDAIIAKKNLGTHRQMAPLTIALGPGFVAGEDVDYVIETQRGHDLGRIISQGSSEKNTGIPGKIQGFDKERVLYASQSGILHLEKQIGDLVTQGEILGFLVGEEEKTPVTASISGVLRGILPQNFAVAKGLKLADIDPRVSEQKNSFTISDKARCIAGSVLELIVAKGN
ncbi:MAG: selenium-dependent molybdenum cofactor biosynthesis protein YqeB [Eubacteriales bacterium]